jgi:hypothetical protein
MIVSHRHTISCPIRPAVYVTPTPISRMCLPVSCFVSRPLFPTTSLPSLSRSSPLLSHSCLLPFSFAFPLLELYASCDPPVPGGPLRLRRDGLLAWPSSCPLPCSNFQTSQRQTSLHSPSSFASGTGGERSSNQAHET